MNLRTLFSEGSAGFTRQPEGAQDRGSQEAVAHVLLLVLVEAESTFWQGERVQVQANKFLPGQWCGTCTLHFCHLPLAEPSHVAASGCQGG